VLKVKKDNNYNVTGDIQMKITKQRLKEIIKEELENSQNEGFFSRVGAKLGKANKTHDRSFSRFEKVFQSLRRADENDAEELLQAANQIIKARQTYVKAMQMDTGEEQAWSGELNSDQFREFQELFNQSIKSVRRMLQNAYELDKAAKLRKEIEAALEIQRREVEQMKADRADARAEAEKNKSGEKLASRPNAHLGFRGDAQSVADLNENKITKDALKSLITEELAKVKSK
jgi:hypothetical protein